MIPLIDLRAQVASIRPEIDAALKAVVDQTAFVLGPTVDGFERDFAAYVGVQHCVGVQSGTAALQLALLSLGVGHGDEVITCPTTFFATAEAVSLVGAQPVFVDAEPDTLLVDPALIESAITPRTKALLPVHLYGQAAAMNAIFEIARRHDLLVLEDCCQAHGATFGDQRVGSLGRAGCFSFYPGKNLGAFGEGGAITTNDTALATRLRSLREHGSPRKYVHNEIGFNYRLESIQAAVLSVKLRHLDAWNARRGELAARYREKLLGVGDVRCLAERSYGQHVYHLFVIRSSRREAIFKQFAEAGISQAIHYPTPVHLQEAYVSLGHRPGSFPIAEAAAPEILSLPMYAEMTEEQQDRVIDAVAAAF